MGFKCGIVGLPNVGKSTLFNALTSTAAAEAANYPFCTIEPNVGEVSVPDDRLGQIAEISKSATTTPTRLTFVDIAGLVAGASKGEGLGNQFLAHIREVDAIAYVLRCFDDDDITHVDGRVDPLADAETVETELMLADMESLEKRIEPLEKKIRGQDKEAKKTLALVEQALALLRDGKPARVAFIAEEDKPAFRALNLLTSKRVLYVCNVDEDSAATGNDYSRLVEAPGRRGSQGRSRRCRRRCAEGTECRRHLRQDRSRARVPWERGTHGISRNPRPFRTWSRPADPCRIRSAGN